MNKLFTFFGFSFFIFFTEKIKAQNDYILQSIATTSDGGILEMPTFTTEPSMILRRFSK